MRVERFIVLVTTAIVATCVIVTQAILPDSTAAPVMLGQFGPPFIHLATPRPEPEIEPTVSCPAYVERYNQHSWVDQLGNRNHLDCQDGTSISRDAGPDGALGTADDVCRSREGACFLGTRAPRTRL
jgi:hypothetical protein